MNMYDLTTHLASSGMVETHIVFSCSKCKGARFSLQTSVMYVAARVAVDAGWRATDSAEILCPECAGGQP